MKRNFALCFGILALCLAIGTLCFISAFSNPSGSFKIVERGDENLQEWTEEEYGESFKITLTDPDPFVVVLYLIKNDEGEITGFEISKKIIESIETDWHKYILKIKLKEPAETLFIYSKDEFFNKKYKDGKGK